MQHAVLQSVFMVFMSIYVDVNTFSCFHMWEYRTPGQETQLTAFYQINIITNQYVIYRRNC